MTHAQERLKQRYGIKPTPKVMQMISRWIKTDSPNVSFKRPAAGKADIYIVNLRKNQIPVVWDRWRKKIVTVLPEGAV